MRIIVDADATPNIKEIIELGNKYQKETLLISDDSHQLKYENATIITVESGSQNADIKLINLIKENDIVITQDYGVAAIALSKKCQAINPSGLIYTNSNIDQLLATKHLTNKLRKNKIHIKGPKKRTKETKDLFLNNLKNMIKNQNNMI